MSTIDIQQDGNQLILTSKSIDWLVNNTSVKVFDPIRFEGYQRKIDEKHCLKIVSYLNESSFLPSAIICSCLDYSDDAPLSIVDGQHRVKAFQVLKRDYPKRFDEIRNQEIPVVVLVGVPDATEIQTFITINKTSKKVDTSLAFVLKNKLSNSSGDLVMPRAEYIAVEAAKMLNDSESNPLWADRILYEGNVKKSNCYISLNAFVKATRVFVNTLNQIGAINLNWLVTTSIEDVESIASQVSSLILMIWETVYQRWPELIDASFEEKQILQGSIGFTAITRALVKLIKQNRDKVEDLNHYISHTILSFKVPYYQWTKKGAFSHYSSESGYRIVSEILLESL